MPLDSRKQNSGNVLVQKECLSIILVILISKDELFNQPCYLIDTS